MRRAAWRRRAARLLRWLVLWPALAGGALAACGGSYAPPCDAASYSQRLALCVAKVAQCEPKPAPCPAEDACLAWVDQWEAQCSGR